jgi:hypothetical protein
VERNKISMYHTFFMDFFYKTRKSGAIGAEAYRIARSLQDGKTVTIASNNENDYCDKLLDILSDQHKLQCKAKRLTRKEPINNLRVVHDSFSEPIGLDILDQKDIFCGWGICIAK